MGPWSFDLQIAFFTTEVSSVSYYHKLLFSFRQEEVTGVITHAHRISSFDSSLVFLIICMSLVVGFLLLNLKRIISQNRIVSKKFN